MAAWSKIRAQITISNSGYRTAGFSNTGMVKNDGKITINNTGFNVGFRTLNGGIVNNDGVITISNSHDSPYTNNAGFANNDNGLVNNYGKIVISNTGSTVGFYNGGEVNNYGKISNYSGSSGFDYDGGTFNGKPVSS